MIVGQQPRSIDHLSIQNVSKQFVIGGESFEALRNVSLSLQLGGFAALIGPSGCGKSTLLRIIADLVSPSSGSVTIAGAPPGEARQNHRIGFVFQDATLLPWRTVLENVRLPLEMVGNSSEYSAAAPTELIDLVGLKGFERAKPAQLSGGMQQRVAIARALVLSPQILLLDEPFGALDEITRNRMNLELLRVWAETRITAVMVTHSIQEAVFMADQVFVLASGPGRLIETVTVDLPRPRRLEHMSSPAFIDAVDQVRRSLFGGHNEA